MTTIRLFTLAIALGCVGHGAQAQQNIAKLGATYYQTHSHTDGINGIGVPPGADAEVSNATTAIFVYERLLTDNVGLEFVLGVPPTIKARATGTISFLGDDVLSARNLAPTIFLTYHFFTNADRLRPYLGAGWNYTRFTDVKSSLAPDVKMGSSNGLALEAGLDYAITPTWGLFASIAKINVKSNIVAAGATVLTTTVDFRPIIYTAGVTYRF